MDSLTPAMQKFILHWGEMGDKWGINRSVAQIYALMYVSDGPLHAEHIAETLKMARSNVSTSLRELTGWGIVRMVHRVGDRRDHYETLTDPWETLEKVLEERRRREIEPTIRVLGECIDQARANPHEGKVVAERLGALRDMLVQGDALSTAIRRIPRDSLMTILKAGGKVGKLFGAAYT
jgi:DNA-binding transcriptional regulator GbsR (MarR family)